MPSNLIRTPRWAQAYALLFMVFWEGALVTTFLTARHPPLLPLGLLATFGLVVLWRTVRSGIDGGTEELVVRNNVRTRRIRRADIVSFDVRQVGPAPVGRLVVTVATRGSRRPTALDVTTRPLFLPGSRAQVERNLTVLRQWLDGSPTAPG